MNYFESEGSIQKNLLRGIQVVLVCMAMLAVIGCGGSGGSGGSGGGGGNTTYTLGGTLGGLVAGESVNLQDNGGDALTVSANGTFSFPMSLDTGSAYAVTVQSHTPGIACSVSNGSGTVGSSNVTGINVSCATGTEKVLYSFGASATDGEKPYAGLVMDSAGNLYGTTYEGGANSLGTVFKITASGTESILHSFGASATDGQTPNAGLIMDDAGNFYGTTEKGGASGLGTVFKISASGTESVLYSFGANATDGQTPCAGLIMDNAGSLYGTTENGGANGVGTVFEIAVIGTESVLYSFRGGTTDGEYPLAGLIMDSARNLYGTTLFAGANNFGTVSRSTPLARKVFSTRSEQAPPMGRSRRRVSSWIAPETSMEQPQLAERTAQTLVRFSESAPPVRKRYSTPSEQTPPMGSLRLRT